MSTKNHLSLLVHTIYAFVTALQLIFVPNMMLGMFGFEPTTEVWIRVVGILVLALSVIYYGLYKYGQGEPIRFSAYGRLVAAAGFTLLALTGQGKMTMILFAVIDALTAIWTLIELKKK